jgi:hypothetical protein
MQDKIQLLLGYRNVRLGYVLVEDEPVLVRNCIQAKRQVDQLSRVEGNIK